MGRGFTRLMRSKFDEEPLCQIYTGLLRRSLRSSANLLRILALNRFLISDF